LVQSTKARFRMCPDVIGSAAARDDRPPSRPASGPR
jgi:hypothetical protein